MFTEGYGHFVRVRGLAFSLVMLTSGLLLSACGNPTALTSAQKKFLLSPSTLACTNMDVVFLHESKTRAIERKNARDAIAWGENSHDAALRSAAFALQSAANASDQTQVNAEIVKFIVACHKLNLGPTDNYGG